jgi:hypothetical protein
MRVRATLRACGGALCVTVLFVVKNIYFPFNFGLILHKNCVKIENVCKNCVKDYRNL